MGGSLRSNVADLYRHRELLWLWTGREIRVRYKQSLLGGLWAVFQPLSLMAIYTVVFAHFLSVPSDGAPYPLFSYTGLIPWTFLSTSLSFAIPSLVGNMSLLGKIWFPREILPMANILASLLDMAIAGALWALLALAYGVAPTWQLLWVPALVALQALLVLGLALAGAGVMVFFRDVRFVVPLALQLWLYASPVIYPTSAVPERLRPIFRLNPMTTLLDGYRRVMLEGLPPDGGELAFAAVLVLAVLAGGYLLFQRLEPLFADLI